MPTQAAREAELELEQMKALAGFEARFRGSADIVKGLRQQVRDAEIPVEEAFTRALRCVTLIQDAAKDLELVARRSQSANVRVRAINTNGAGGAGPVQTMDRFTAEAAVFAGTHEVVGPLPFGWPGPRSTRPQGGV